jgi:hypothetical protein
MLLRTDDDIYRARLVYLGPPGYTLPIQLPYAQYGLFALLSAAFVVLTAMVTGSWMNSVVAIAAAMFATSYIWGHVDFDRPARKVLKVALTDWRAIKSEPEKLPRLTARHIRFSDLNTGDHR